MMPRFLAADYSLQSGPCSTYWAEMNRFVQCWCSEVQCLSGLGVCRERLSERESCVNIQPSVALVWGKPRAPPCLFCLTSKLILKTFSQGFWSLTSLRNLTCRSSVPLSSSVGEASFPMAGLSLLFILPGLGAVIAIHAEYIGACETAACCCLIPPSISDSSCLPLRRISAGVCTPFLSYRLHSAQTDKRDESFLYLKCIVLTHSPASSSLLVHFSPILWCAFLIFQCRVCKNQGKSQGDLADVTLWEC